MQPNARQEAQHYQKQSLWRQIEPARNCACQAQQQAQRAVAEADAASGAAASSAANAEANLEAQVQATSGFHVARQHATSVPLDIMLRPDVL